MPRAWNRSGGVTTRQVHCTGGYLSQSSKTIHFGLGDATAIDRLEICWPSVQRQVLSLPEVDRLHEITEPQSSNDELLDTSLRHGVGVDQRPF
jgi:hypothetical protein